MLRSYGGYTWSGEEPAALHPESHKLLGYSALALGGTWLAYKAIQTQDNGFRAVDYVAASARLGGNLFPFQLANTFRIPEFLSPFFSEKYRAGDAAGYNHWDAKVLSTDSTHEWLKYTTGLSSEELRARGVVRGMTPGDKVATALHWTPTEGSRGVLEAIMPDGGRHLLSRDVALQAMNDEIDNPFTTKRGLNKAVEAQFAAADMFSKPGFKAGDVGASPARFVDREQVAAREVASHIFTPSIKGETKTFADLSRRTNYLRSIPAFEMGRFNQLLTNVSEQFLGDTGKKLFNNVLKIGPGVKPGPASHMFGRYGLLVAGTGGIIMANQQLDWFRRKNIGGHALASAVTSGGIAYLAAKLGQNPRTAATIGMASFLGQMVLPGFDKGLTEGVATLGINADLLRANPLNPINYYRRTLEGFVPGISDWKTGALLAIGAGVATGITLPGMKERISTKIARQFGHPNIGEVALQGRSTRDLFYESVGQHLNIAPEDTYGFINRKQMLAAFQTRSGDKFSHTRALNTLWHKSEEQFHAMKTKNTLNEDYLMPMLRKIADQHPGSGLNAFQREVKGFVAQAYAGFFGADISHNKTLLQEARGLGFGRYGPTTHMGRIGAVGLAVFAAQQLLTGGALSSMENYRDLRNEYAGKKLVEVKKSRWWEAGGQPFEGSTTSYFRPSAYAMMMNRVHEKSVWGENEDEISPLHKFFTKNFTYDLEKQNYYNRPYPVSSAAFEDVPIIGGFLGASIGNLIKPARLMHVGEWMREDEQGNPQFANVFKGSMMEPSYENGAVGPGRPIAPGSLAALHSNYVDQFRQLSGMTGWASNTIDKVLFGNSSMNSDNQRLASAGDMTSWRNAFWDADIGGALFSSEFLRRIFPRTPGDVKSYNPITNNMPAWLPDKLHYGDPYRSIANGEARLPGAGFAAFHPELEGVDPEAYPLLYRYQILSDVAPLTPEFFKAQEQIYKQRQTGMMTERENVYIDQIDSYRAKVVNQNSYQDIPAGAITLPGSGITRGISRALGAISRRVAAPAEYLIPMGFRPLQKLTGDGMGPIERYEQERMYGTSLAFWDKPVRDWLRPSAYSALHLMGYQGKPLWRQEADTTNQYFDQLNFVKYMGLAEQATAAGDTKSADQFRWQASQTRSGVNPQGSPLSIYWSMPAEERPYFNSFAQTTNMSERERILQMVPEDEKNLYRALWSRKDSGDVSLYNRDTQIDDQHMGSQMESTMQQIGGTLPNPSWVGYHCLPPIQNVLSTDLQPIHVDRIAIQDPVWQTGVENFVLEVLQRNAVGEQMYKVTVQRDRVNSLMATENHKVLAWRCPWGLDHLRRKINKTVRLSPKDFQPQWIPVSKLMIQDYLVIPLQQDVISEEYVLDMYQLAKDAGWKQLRADEYDVWVYYPNKKQANTFPRYLTLTKEIAWLVGYYLAEGHTSYRGGKPRGIDFTSNLLEEHDIRRMCLDILNQAKIQGGSEHQRIRKSGSCGSVAVKNCFAGLLLQYFAPGVAHTKQLRHSNQLLTSQSHREALLAGYYVGDGSKEQECSYAATVSKTLAYQVYELLISCGVSPSFSFSKRKRKDCWTVRFVRNSDAARRIHNQIIRDRLSSRDVAVAKPKAFIVNGYLFSKIHTITHEEYSGPVYDLNVENLHEYRCSIGLYHNSDIDMSDVKVRYIDQIGADLHDYGLWESDEKKSMAQPFLNGSADFMLRRSRFSNVRGEIYNMLGNTMGGPQMNYTVQPGVNPYAHITYNDDRSSDISRVLSGYSG